MLLTTKKNLDFPTAIEVAMLHARAGDDQVVLNTDFGPVAVEFSGIDDVMNLGDACLLKESPSSDFTMNLRDRDDIIAWIRIDYDPKMGDSLFKAEVTYLMAQAFIITITHSGRIKNDGGMKKLAAAIAMSHISNYKYFMTYEGSNIAVDAYDFMVSKNRFFKQNNRTLRESLKRSAELYVNELVTIRDNVLRIYEKALFSNYIFGDDVHATIVGVMLHMLKDKHLTLYVEGEEINPIKPENVGKINNESLRKFSDDNPFSVSYIGMLTFIQEFFYSVSNEADKKPEEESSESKTLGKKINEDDDD